MRKYLIPLAFLFIVAISGCDKKATHDKLVSKKGETSVQKQQEPVVVIPTDTVAYNKKNKFLANGDTTGLWPVKKQPYPLAGAILPHKRIIAYYGNLYSKKMGVLGEYPPKELWRKLNAEVKAWQKADPATPVQPAIHYIAVVASGSPLKDGKYRTRMPAHQIDSAMAIAKMGNAIVFLDVQVSLSDVKTEVPLLEKYLRMSNVHLGIDPEFSMKDGSKPGHKIGTMDATDVNFCSDYLAKLVRDNNLTPKILVVHRFTQGMIRNYKNIKLHPNRPCSLLFVLLGEV